MSVLPVGFGGGVGASYQIEKSLRFRGVVTPYLSRTPGSAGDRKKWTWSAWTKRGALAGQRFLFFAGATSSEYTFLGFTAADQLRYARVVGGVIDADKQSSAVFRDPSAPMHILCVEDAANLSSKLFVNGVELTYGTNNQPSNVDGAVNAVVIHRIGEGVSGIALGPYDGHLSEIHFIDGQALTPNEFGIADPVTGEWAPKRYTGTYGASGFYLPFNDIASLTTLTADASGNGNNWTATNISLTAGTTYDSSDDTPTNNFCSVSPLHATAGLLVVSQANTFINVGAADKIGYGTAVIPQTGKWYFEYVLNTVGAASVVGIATGDAQQSPGVGFTGLGAAFWTNWAGVASNGDVAMYAINRDTGNIWYGRNGVWLSGNPALGTSPSGTGLGSREFLPAAYINSANGIFNFGQRPFSYTPPTDFLALNTQNYPEPAIQPATQDFQVRLDTGANILATAQGTFTDELAWIKDRSTGNAHQLIDSVRGTSAVLQSNTTGVETTYSAPSGSSVAWVWKSQNTGVANTDGSISSTVSANTAAGFSIVTWTGTGANGTLGHGLGAVPQIVIAKRRNVASDWPTQHAFLVAANSLYLNTTAVSAAATTVWNSTKPTSSVFSVGTSATVNASGGTYVAYCFAEKENFSRIAHYTGNGSTDGTFVYCGFRPAFILIKRTNSTSNWLVFDCKRLGYNVDNELLIPNLTNGEATTDLLDLTATGFKLRTTDIVANASGGTYIFMAFAEFPFKYSRAR